MKESALKKKLIKRMYKEFSPAWGYCPSDRFSDGISDVIMCIGGLFVAVELKRPENKKRDDLQIYTVGQVISAGGFAILSDDIEEIIKAIKKWRMSWDGMKMKLS